MDREFFETTYEGYNLRVDRSCLYSMDEVWVRHDGELAIVGITDYLQMTSGEATFVDLPALGAILEKDEEAASIGMDGAAVSVKVPVSGTVVEINEDLESSPDLVNSDAYGKGWLFKLEPGNWDDDIAELLFPDAYLPVMLENLSKM
ncbi:glycine cleavage system protein H [Youngiibacter multivorans]|uniref:Glycine cleavage system H protein n=1 Tax=Youngiibacter multivorans TaxID=937251 RepID=A0ABS4G043_9CLOT|nr:glycine cleavage system protein H [Youngiibacter multivorans]MBP1917924.1 glycine cleavage system H protein [Youngiibacter multivorans]